MVSDATLSPKTKGISDIQDRMEKLERYENNEVPTKVDFVTLVGKEKWDQHWKNWEVVQETMREAQVLATEINKTVAKSYAKL